MEPVREELKSGEGGRKSYFSVLNNNVIFLGEKKKKKKTEERVRRIVVTLFLYTLFSTHQYVLSALPLNKFHTCSFPLS